MIYLSSFRLSNKKLKNPNIYPYNVFADREWDPFVFGRITVFCGNNASGKSTLLNIIGNVLSLYGTEAVAVWGSRGYFSEFCSQCGYSLGEEEDGRPVKKLPLHSRYIKSEDVLYEIKKIQKAAILEEDYIYEHVRRGMKKEQAVEQRNKESYNYMEIRRFAQEKYSNGETSLQLFDDWIEPSALYLMDEPEVSLSPQNQIVLAERLNHMSRFLNCQFIIATHSPFMLGTLDARIYDIDSRYAEVKTWNELENVRFMYEFFQKHKDVF